MTKPTDTEAIASVEGYAELLKAQHALIDALPSAQAVLDHAETVQAAGWPDYVTDELMHHLEARRIEFVRRAMHP